MFKLKGSYYFCTEENFETVLETEIEITYTGVYHLKCYIHIGDEYTKDELQRIYKFLKISEPFKYEKTFETLNAALPKEVLDLLLEKGKATYIDSWFQGKMRLNFPEWCVEEYESDFILNQITESLQFITGYVEV